MSFLPDLPVSTIIALLVTVLVAGGVRGFSGFGGGLVFMPVASALVDPRLAAASFLVFDFVVASPLAVRAVTKADWHTVLPATIAAAITIPFGAFVLASGDVTVLRWAISAIALSLTGLLLTGWRYRGRPTPPISAGVGAVSGFLGGFAQISGPPVVAFWMSGPAPAAIIRANLITYFMLMSLASFAAYWFNGFFTAEILGLLVLLVPVYALAIWLGARAFGISGERSYRSVAYLLIALAAISSLPVFDTILR